MLYDEKKRREGKGLGGGGGGGSRTGCNGKRVERGGAFDVR